MILGQLDIYLQKNEIRLPFHATYKNELKMN